MTKIPALTGKALEKILLALGFEKVRQKGSHAFYKHKDGRVTTIPHHPGNDLTKPLLRTILKDIKISPLEFSKLLS